MKFTDEFLRSLVSLSYSDKRKRLTKLVLDILDNQPNKTIDLYDLERETRDVLMLSELGDLLNELTRAGKITSYPYKTAVMYALIRLQTP